MRSFGIPRYANPWTEIRYCTRTSVDRANTGRTWHFFAPPPLRVLAKTPKSHFRKNCENRETTQFVEYSYIASYFKIVNELSKALDVVLSPNYLDPRRGGSFRKREAPKAAGARSQRRKRLSRNKEAASDLTRTSASDFSRPKKSFVCMRDAGTRGSGYFRGPILS